jgi:hypothetical protein
MARATELLGEAAPVAEEARPTAESLFGPDVYARPEVEQPLTAAQVLGDEPPPAPPQAAEEPAAEPPAEESPPAPPAE